MSTSLTKPIEVPRIFDEVPRTQLLFPGLPIVHRLPRLSKTIDPTGNQNIWICREDCSSGLAFGGNKVRKLEYVVQDAIDKGADTLVTTGGVQSNHMRQTAAVAGMLGMKAILVPKDMVDPGNDSSSYFSAGNVQLNSIMAAETLPIGTTQEEAVRIVEKNGGKPYWIPSGCSQHPLGGLGYARFAMQLAEWEDQNSVTFDTIVAPCGGGSTLAGIVVGNSYSHGKRKIVGVSIFAKPKEETETTVMDIVLRTDPSAGADHSNDLKPFYEDSFEIDVDHHCGAYGEYDEKTKAAIKLVAESEGVLLDPIYTGKTMAGLIDMVKKDASEDPEPNVPKDILFVHTGGQSAISAYPSLR